jgi:hypothetical protein
LVRTANRYHTIQIGADQQLVTTEDPAATRPA